MIDFLKFPFDIFLLCGPVFEYIALPIFLSCFPVFAVYIIKSFFGGF